MIDAMHGSAGSMQTSSVAAWVGFDQERSLGPGEEGSRTALHVDLLHGRGVTRRA